jgi:serine/arginine repetitive matrix protein 2
MHLSPAPNPTVSPGKSSLTSRRLRGPRLSDPSQAQVYGAQTFPSAGSIARRLGAAGKTVTFRDVADVKEFQAESSGGEWEDEGEYEEGESWDEVLLGPPGSGGQRTTGEEENHTFRDESFVENTPSPEMDLSGLKRYGSLNARPSPARSPLQRERGAAYAEQEREEEEGYAGYVAQLEHQQQHRQHPPQHGYDEESTTANFIDSLYADGYLSPPGSQGGVSASGTFDGLAATLEREVDAYGVPLGRSHHADRAAEAHAVERDHHHGHVQQPALPRAHADEAVGETMLRTGDARTPATAVASREPYGNDIPAHQDGQFVDPFVTIQTATRVSAIDYHGAQPASQREEDGVPLGRTSHAERAKVARQLATRGLGLGMPARPMVPFVMGGMRGQQSESGSEDEDDDRGYSIPNLATLVAEPEEQRQATRQHAQPEVVSLAPLVSPFPQQVDEMNPVDQAGSISKRALPKPPKPTPVMGMPSPVEKNENQRESRPVPEERVTSPVGRSASCAGIATYSIFVDQGVWTVAAVFPAGFEQYDKSPVCGWPRLQQGRFRIWQRGLGRP